MASSALIKQFSTRPNVTKEQSIPLANKLFGLQVPLTALSSVKELESYDDRNFYIKGKLEQALDRNEKKQKSTQEEEFVLKIINSSESKHQVLIRLNSELLLFLNRKGINCPTPQTSLYGSTEVFCRFQQKTQGNVSTERSRLNDVIVLSNEDLVDASPEKDGKEICAVKLFSFVPGTLLCDVEFTKDLLVDLGLHVAHLHKAMKEFSCLNAYASARVLSREEFRWNLRNMPTVVESFLHVVENKQRRQLVESVCLRFKAEVLPKLDSLESQIIHGDINEHNIIVQTKPEGGSFIRGFIDYSDIQNSYRVLDIAIALSYIMMMSPNTRMSAFDAASHFLASYQSEFPLSSAEIDMLYIAAAARCCQSLVIGAYQYKYLEKGNEYLLFTAKSGWQGFEELMNTPEREVLNAWKTEPLMPTSN